MRFVAALNTIGSQPWAFALVVIGIITIIVSHKNGIDIGIGSGIIGAGVNMFTSHKSDASTGNPTQPAPQSGQPEK